MANIKIEPANVRRVLSSQESLARKLRTLSQDVDSIRSALNYKIAGREQISARLRQMTEDILKESTRTTALRDALEQIVSHYEQAETKNLGLSVAEVIANVIANVTAAAGNDVQSGEKLLETSPEDMDRYISEFEKTHSKEAKAINKFLAGGSNNQLTEEDIRNIKYLAYNAKEPYRSIYLKSLSKFKIGDADMNNGNAYYHPAQNIFDRDMHTVNYSYPDHFSDDPRGAYTTLFHECGHAIDDLSDESKWWGSDTENYTAHSDAMGRDVTLREAIEYDVYYNTSNPHSMTSIANEIKAARIPGTGSKELCKNIVTKAGECGKVKKEEEQEGE